MSLSPKRISVEVQEAELPCPIETTLYTRIPHPTWLHAAGNIVSPLHVSAYRWLCAGRFLSHIGDIFYTLSMPWFLLGHHGGAQTLSLVLMAHGAPRILGLVMSGPLIDRLRSRTVILLASSGRACLTLVLAFIIAQGHPALWLLCCISALLGICGGLFMPAEQAITPALLPDRVWQAGNALTMISLQLATVLGSCIVGVIIGNLPAMGTLGINALVFVAATFLFMGMSEPRHSTIVYSIKTRQKTFAFPAPSRTWVDDKALDNRLTFWQLFRKSSYLQIWLIILVFMNVGLGGAIGVALPALLRHQFHVSASSYGFVVAGTAIGGLVGALGAGMLGKIPYRSAVGLLFFVAQAVVLIFLPWSPSVMGIWTILVVAGALHSVGHVMVMTVMQQNVPRHLMGRSMSAFVFASMGVHSISLALAGVVIAHLGPGAAFVVASILIMLSCLLGYSQRAFRLR